MFFIFKIIETPQYFLILTFATTYTDIRIKHLK